MKNTLLRIFTAALVVIMSAVSFTSCIKKYDAIYFEGANGEIVSGFNENMLSYHMSMEKTTLLYGMGITSDVPDLWKMTVKDIGYEIEKESENKTIAQIYDASAISTAKTMIAASYLYDEIKKQDTVEGRVLKASDERMEAQVDNVVSQLQLTMGSKEKFESFISGYGITLSDFRKYYEMSYKTSELRSALDVSEDEKKDYFKNNYAIVKHILINTNSKTNDAGEKVSLTPEEKEAKLSVVKAIEARLSAGEDYEAVYEEYKGEDPGTDYYTEGYFVTDNNMYMPEFQDAALEMNDGEVRTVYTSYGAHIMKKYPMDPEKYNFYNDVNSEITSVLKEAKYIELVKPYVDMVKINDRVVKEYSVATVPMMTPDSVQ
ncbi:MAG: peptidylprolyl isomerase [Clostridia bacterium]|nr:peptidylprolyl isomerase [Clostridia bacterium]